MNRTLLFVATALMSFCTPATAAIITTTMNGTLTEVSNPGNLSSNFFGLGPGYEGTAFNLVFTFDDQTIGADSTSSSLSGVGPLACSGCFGAPGFGVLTMNGISRRIGNENSASLRRELSNTLLGVYLADATGFPKGRPGGSVESVSIQFQGTNIFPITDITNAFSHTAQEGDESFFNYSYYDGESQNDSLNLAGTISDINVSVTSAVPEPATWAMFIFGFGLIGSSMRRRRSTSAKPITLQRV